MFNDMSKEQPLLDQTVAALNSAEVLAAYGLQLRSNLSGVPTLVVTSATFDILSSTLARGLESCDITTVLQSGHTLDDLSRLITCFSSGLELCLKPAVCPSTAAIQLAKVIAASGLLPALSTFCESLASALQQAAAQHKQLATEVADLLSETYVLWQHLASWWPGKLLVGSRGLAVTILPMARLVVATFCNTAAFCSPASSDNAAATSSHEAITAACGRSLSCAWKAAAMLLKDCYDEFEASGNRSNSVSVAGRVVLTNKALQDAAYISFAAAVTELTCLLGGSSDSDPQQQQNHSEVAAYHDELWAELGCPTASSTLAAAIKPDSNVDVDQKLSQASIISLIIAELGRLEQPTAALEDQAEELVSEQAQTSEGHLQQQQQMFASRAQALFKVHLELLLLLPPSTSEHMTICLGASQLLQSQLQTWIPPQQVCRLNGNLLAPAFKIARKVQQAVRSMANEPSVMLPPEQGLDTTSRMAEMLELCNLLLLDMVFMSDVELFSSAVSADPDATLRSLEMILRTQVPLLHPAEPVHSSITVLRAACKVVSLMSPADAAGGPLAEPMQQPQASKQTQLSLLLTCSKLASKCMPDCSRPEANIAGEMCLVLAVLVLLAAMELNDTNQGRSSSSHIRSESGHSSGPSSRVGSSHNAASHVPLVDSSWLMLVGRSCATAGRCLATDPSEPPLSASVNCALISPLIESLTWLDTQLLPRLAGKAAVHDDLQEQLVVLQHLLWSAVSHSSEAGIRVQLQAGSSMLATLHNGASTSSTEAVDACCPLSERIISKMQQFGEAACAALPVPDCCNNPACCNFTGESEQQLVSGKSCVCGGCEVARYCGRDCQTVHWKQHKAACKSIRKARQA